MADRDRQHMYGWTTAPPPLSPALIRFLEDSGVIEHRRQNLTREVQPDVLPLDVPRVNDVPSLRAADEVLRLTRR